MNKKIQEQPVHWHASGLHIALVGNPNCGKSSIFNALTGSRQKVANYAGVTVERKEGWFKTPQNIFRVLDLPGTYGLSPRSPDEKVTLDVLSGQAVGEKKPDVVLCVVSALHLPRGLRLLRAIQRMGHNVVLVLNMMDMAKSAGISIDTKKLSELVKVPVIETVGKQQEGVEALRTFLTADDGLLQWLKTEKALTRQSLSVEENIATEDSVIIANWMRELNLSQWGRVSMAEKIDRWVLHPIVGSFILIAILFLVFQAVFEWSSTPTEWIEQGTSFVADWVNTQIPEGLFRQFLTEGVVAGLGGVLVFLPQIIILFFFILVLEESGYLPRAALLLDRLMRIVGLSGRSFIPLLSSFACAIPGIMATRTIANPRDRLVTILVAPLMTCSARLPVYALLIGAFVPEKTIAGGFNQQGFALFVLYLAGIIGAFLVAWVLKLFGHSHHQQTLMLELPEYHWPVARNVLLGLWQRVVIFLQRVGGIIFILTVLLWVLSTFPLGPIESSFAGQLGRALNVILAPIGFNWQISVALVPSMAAREVVVSSLATIYAVSDSSTEGLAEVIQTQWSTATAYALLAWFVFAPQCLSTLAIIKRETGGWKIPLFTAGYLFGLAYLSAFATYQLFR